MKSYFMFTLKKKNRNILLKKKKNKEKTKRPLYLTNHASNRKTNIISTNKVDYLLPISPIISSQNVLIRPKTDFTMY